MKLTDNEIETLETHLCGFEKRAARRGSLAWVYMGTSLFFVLLMALAWSALRHHAAGVYEGIQVFIEGGVTARPDHMSRLYLLSGGVVFLVSAHMAVWSLVQAIKSWRRGPRELIIAKVLRAKWEEEKAAMAGEARAPAVGQVPPLPGSGED